MMANSKDIVTLYKTVFEKYKATFNVTSTDIISGINKIGEAYRDDPDWKEKPNPSSTCFENASHRCAYLHKYWMVHTGLLCDVLDTALKIHSVKEIMCKSDVGSISLCSLGSGPGTDIVAFLFILKEHFGTKRTIATMVDCCGEWQSVFEIILSELKSRDFINDMVSKENFSFEYVVADLLNFGGHERCHQHERLSEKIKSADIITMVKFVSAAGCKNTKKMVKNIFKQMKPGALLLFVDNAGGGYYEMMSQAAKEGGMESLFDLRRQKYEEKKFYLKYSGMINRRETIKESQWEATIACEIWKKSEILPLNTTEELKNQFYNRKPKFTYNDFPPLQKTHCTIEGGYDEIDSFVLQSASLTCENISKDENRGKCCTIM